MNEPQFSSEYLEMVERLDGGDPPETPTTEKLIARRSAAACSACGGCTMLPGHDEDEDVMNTPCWKCNEHAKLCGNCWHACQPFDVPPLGDHVHCNHPVIEVRDSPPYNHGWGTLRDARETCPHWIPRQNDEMTSPRK